MKNKIIVISLTLLIILFLDQCSAPQRVAHPCEGLTDQECFKAALDLSEKGRIPEAREMYLYDCEINKLGEACTNLGVFAVKDKDFFDARLWFQMACDLGSGLGCAHRGCSFECIPECGPCKVEALSTKKALEFFSKGCEIGSAEGCYDAAMVQLRLKRDKKAGSLFQEGCNLGMKESCEKAPKTKPKK